MKLEVRQASNQLAKLGQRISWYPISPPSREKGMLFDGARPPCRILWFQFQCKSRIPKRVGYLKAVGYLAPSILDETAGLSLRAAVPLKWS